MTEVWKKILGFLTAKLIMDSKLRLRAVADYISFFSRTLHTLPIRIRFSGTIRYLQVSLCGKEAFAMRVSSLF